MTTDSAQDQWTVRKVLTWTTEHLKKSGSDSARLDAELLLAHARGCRRLDLYTQHDAPLTDEERERMRDLVKRRSKAEPVAYLIGTREFYSLEFQVTSDVLIPRPDTETLVMTAVEWCKSLLPPAPERDPSSEAEPPEPPPAEPIRVLDLCTGSGCVAVALADALPHAALVATDISEAALEVARANAVRNDVGGRIDFRRGDLFAATEGVEFDLIVGNPPYIRDAEMTELAADVRNHEPHLALQAGADGLDLLRRIVSDAGAHLRTGGRLMLEHGHDQGADVRGLFESEGNWTSIATVKDAAGHGRVTLAERT